MGFPPGTHDAFAEMPYIFETGRTRYGAISLEVAESSSCCGFGGQTVVRVESGGVSSICLDFSPLLLVVMVHKLHIGHAFYTRYQSRNSNPHGIRHVSGSLRAFIAVPVCCSGPLHNHCIVLKQPTKRRQRLTASRTYPHRVV